MLAVGGHLISVKLLLVDEPCAYGSKAHRVQVGHVGSHALTIALQRSAESMRVDKGCKWGA